jgi:hypothetical protein
VFAPGSTTGMFGSSTVLDFTISGSDRFRWHSAGMSMGSAMAVGWGSSTGVTTAMDTSVARCGAGIVCVNGQLSVPNPTTAPATPSTGGVLYIDSGDGNKLKVKFSTGTVVTLGTP